MTSDSPADCPKDPGLFAPIVNFGKCEGKAACAKVCPEHVFEVRRIDDPDLARLNFFQRFKLRVHGYQVAYTPHADACRACGLCVTACPEGAIILRPTAPARTCPLLTSGGPDLQVRPTPDLKVRGSGSHRTCAVDSPH